MITKAKKLVQELQKKGVLKTKEILNFGISKEYIRELTAKGLIERISRGYYSLPDYEYSAMQSIAEISKQAPKGVICLLSALAFYESTSEIPKYVNIAIPRGTHANRIKYPPVRFYRFVPNAWKAGIEEREIEGHKIRLYNLAKTIADCFKFRNKIGVDVARDALRVAVTEKSIKPEEIMQYAKICRVDNIIKPILEAML